ncbi:MAG: hypothetical protein COB36_10740 [Alphaproteobacteria bacterium]|nr:MAG: hypothetical protein COB36_10740 [Alphaproteobacteria bacterium]
MGLKETFQSTADQLFDVFSDFIKTVDYSQFVTGAYDPSTGKSGDYGSAVNAEIILTSYRADQIDGTVIQVDDKVALMRNPTFTPSTSDKFVQNSETWNVVHADDGGSDGILWTLQARR